MSTEEDCSKFMGDCEWNGVKCDIKSNVGATSNGSDCSTIMDQTRCNSSDGCYYDVFTNTCVGEFYDPYMSGGSGTGVG